MERILILGDMHVGSIFALAPLESIPQDRKNIFHDWVYSKWKDLVKQYDNLNYLILVGDIADGSQIKSLGIDALYTDTDVQVREASRLLKMIKVKSQIFGINGSGYHGGEGQGTNIDRRITEEIGGIYKGNIFEFDIKDERIQVSHGGGGTSIVGLHSYILREIALSKQDAQKRKTKAPTILVRGHQHRMFSIQDDAGVYGVLNGCWQYTTPYMVKKSANITPSIGATMIEVDDNNTKIFRIEYPIPEEVRQGMIGFETLEYKRKEKRNKDNLECLKETLKGKSL